MKIYWGTRLRGFLRQLSNEIPDVEFVDNLGYYETNSNLRKLISKMIRLKLINPTGMFQVSRVNREDCDYYASFNRFLKVDKPYFIYLENPTALYHYTLGRISSKLGKQKFLSCLQDPNLRYFVCMSKACEESFERVNMPLPPHVKIKTIYPFVQKNKSMTVEKIGDKSNRECLECLYCVQGIRFISKGGLEVMRAVQELRAKGLNIHLTIITKISDLDKRTLQEIEQCKETSLYDFNLSYSQLEEIYGNTNILLQPSSDESFGLTVLEAMKSGCAIIASKLYAFPEMVIDEYNGYLVEPKYWFFDRDNIPNPKVWNHRKKTIYSHKESKELKDAMKDKILKLYNDRELLNKFSLSSWQIANEKFGEERIIKEWTEVFQYLKN